MRDPAQPLRRRLYLLALVMVVLAIALAVSACQPTGSTRCDSVLVPQNVSIGDHGAVLRCDPSYDPDEPATAIFIVQWNRERPIVWLWPDRIDDDRVLRLLAWIGDGEVVAHARGMVPATYKAGVPASVAVWAGHYAWCREQIPGVGASGYSVPAEGCGAYL